MLFQNICFSLDSGDVLHLTGANGTGKSSFLRILAGALPVVAGNVLWEGHDFLENGLQSHATRFAFLPPDDKSLKSMETVGEVLKFWHTFSATPAQAGVRSLKEPDSRLRGGGDVCESALQKMNILSLKDTPIRHLSAGQKRRVSLARIFLRPVPLWLLDEPLNALDTEAQELFLHALDDHCQQGGIAVIAGHQPLAPLRHGQIKRLDTGDTQ